MQTLEKIKGYLTSIGAVLIGLAIAYSPDFDNYMKERDIQKRLLSAQPVKLGRQIVGSSSQVKYKFKQYTLTNKHVCAVSGTGNLVNVGGWLRKILYVDKKHDLCILQPNMEAPPLDLASSYGLSERIRIIGHPRGIEQTVREGRIIGLGHAIFGWVHTTHEIPYMRVSALGYGGNSGSPVLNYDGKVVGVIFAGNGYHTEMWAVPLEAIKEMFKDYLDVL